MYICNRAQKSGRQVAKLAAVRGASAILDRYNQRPSLNHNGRFWLAVYSMEAGYFLRRRAAAEAIHLLNRANRTLQELADKTAEMSTARVDRKLEKAASERQGAIWRCLTESH